MDLEGIAAKLSDGFKVKINISLWIFLFANVSKWFISDCRCPLMMLPENNWNISFILPVIMESWK